MRWNDPQRPRNMRGQQHCWLAPPHYLLPTLDISFHNVSGMWIVRTLDERHERAIAEVGEADMEQLLHDWANGPEEALEKWFVRVPARMELPTATFSSQSAAATDASADELGF